MPHCGIAWHRNRDRPRNKDHRKKKGKPIMKRIQVPEFGPPEIMQFVEQDDLSPGADEVTIDVDEAS